VSTELWDLLDADGRPTGRLAARTAAGDPAADLAPGDWRRIVCVCLFNPSGQLLIQRRDATKRGWPGRWDITAGGSVLAGETSQQGAARELREEVGVDLDLTGQRPHLTLTGPTAFYDYYVADVGDLDPAGLTLQAEEVQAVRWAGLPEILAMIDDGTFVPLHRPLAELLFAVRLKPGDVSQDAY